MTSHGSTINCETNPEGYITDFPFSAVKHKESADGRISVKLNNLPVTATVAFELEKILITSQMHSSFTIETESQSNHLMLTKQIFKSNTSVDGKMVYVSVNQPLILIYHSQIVPTSEEHVRLKFKGESILQFRLENWKVRSLRPDTRLIFHTI